MSIPSNSYSSPYRSIIARFDPIENSWTNLGNLNIARSGLGVVRVDNEFIVVGGSREGPEDIPAESCSLNGLSIICTTRDPQLSKFTHYPELILIP